MGITSRWTDLQIEQLKALWPTGLASREIAEKIGVTRGMLASKRFNLGLPTRTGLVMSAAQGINAKRTAELCGRVTSPAVKARRSALVARVEAVMGPTAESQPRSWETRVVGECAWPVSGTLAATASCCARTAAGSPYCAAHRALGTRPREDLTPKAIIRMGEVIS
jgi:hypothetical protein